MVPKMRHAASQSRLIVHVPEVGLYRSQFLFFGGGGHAPSARSSLVAHRVFDFGRGALRINNHTKQTT